MLSKLKTAFLVAMCAACSLAASQCAPSPARQGRAAEDTQPPGRLEAVQWTPQATPERIAAWATEGCRGRANRGECLEKALISVIEPAGVDKAMGALLIISKQDPAIERDGHVYAHGIGIAAYKSPETVSQRFALCTTDFQSGCYHGVIQAFFADSRAGGAGVTAEKLNSLCTDYRTPDKRWLDFQCSHGMGHGLMAVNAHNLLKALDACDLLTETFERQGCWGGAFMENVINTTHPHHTSTTQTGGDHHAAAGHGGQNAGGGQAQQAVKPDSSHGHDAHAQHGAGHDSAHAASGGHADGHAGHATAQAAAQPFKALDRNEPLYPCTIVKEHHRRQCYLMQTSAVLWMNNGDFSAASEQCKRAPQDYQQTCYQSLGRDANSWARGNPERAIRYCAAAPDEVEAFCIVGVVKNIVDVTAKPVDGLEFCKQVPDATKPACYRAVGQQVALLQPTDAGRERECRAAETGYVTECRFGAGLGLLRSEE